MEINKEKIIDYLTLAIAILGIVETFRQFVIGNLTPEQAVTANMIFVIISQFGSLFRSIKAELQKEPELSE